MSGTMLGGAWARVSHLMVAVGITLLLAACSGMRGGDSYEGSSAPASTTATPAGAAIGGGQVKVGLILPLTAPGNAALAAQAMKNAAEMAMSEFNNPNIQLLVKDDAGTAPGAQLAAQQAISEGAEIILGPLFAHSVGAAAQITRQRGVPIVAFSTDTNVAASGVYLLSFLPESDVDRIVDYAMANGKHSFAALLPDNAYGNVVDGAFRQVVGRRGGRVVALEHYGSDKANLQEPAQRIAAAARESDAILLPRRGRYAAQRGANAGRQWGRSASPPALGDRCVG